MACKEKINEVRKREDDIIWSQHRNMAGPVPSVFHSFQKKCMWVKLLPKMMNNS